MLTLSRNNFFLSTFLSRNKQIHRYLVEDHFLGMEDHVKKKWLKSIIIKDSEGTPKAQWQENNQMRCNLKS